MLDTWKTAQVWEAEWHGNCINSYGEEEKQLIYAEKMGLIRTPDNKTPYRFDLQGKSILDIGGGAYSLLLKCVNHKDSMVTDPLMFEYPKWVTERYKEAGINYTSLAGEEILEAKEDNINDDLKIDFDEVWIYNVLEHTYDPKKIIENALELSKVVRIFEWLNTPPSEGHPQTLKEKELNEWLGGEGKTEVIKRGRANGLGYYGVFKGRHYE